MDSSAEIVKSHRRFPSLSDLRQTLANIADAVRKDCQAAFEKDPALRSWFELITCYPGLQALVVYRFTHLLYRNRCFWLARFLSHLARLATGVEIHPGAQIGRGIFIDHGMGVVIGETAILGDNALLYHGVTLGGTGKHKGKRHPTLGNNVVVGAGALILGDIEIGHNVRIGAGAVVLHSLPSNCTAVGVPAKVVVYAGQRIRDSQSVESTVRELRQRVQVLEDQLQKLQTLETFVVGLTQ